VALIFLLPSRSGVFGDSSPVTSLAQSNRRVVRRQMRFAFQPLSALSGSLLCQGPRHSSIAPWRRNFPFHFPQLAILGEYLLEDRVARKKEKGKRRGNWPTKELATKVGQLRETDKLRRYITKVSEYLNS
jgi:hypothetical protein